MQWLDAIKAVLQEAPSPMHYTDITQQIIDRGLRPEGIGATPANTVNANLTYSINNEGRKSSFIRVDRGVYALRQAQADALAAPAPKAEEISATSQITGVVNAFGMFWERSKVLWKANPRILGQQQIGASQVDFSSQKGVYLLHDAQGVVYVGQIKDQGLGQRLFQHTGDRLNGRWTRFSWFGVFPVRDTGTLKLDAEFKLDIGVVITTMEAVLIEGLEPRQNRRRGDDFQAVEFLQFEDPEIDVERKRALMNEVIQQIGSRAGGGR